jgi:hypothetical protein
MPALGLGLSLGRGSATAIGVAYAPAALAWFTAVETAGSTFAAGAKDAYNDFFISETANGNLATFDNGMLLAFAGFTGLNGCFVPLKSRGGSLPTNVGFVSGNKVEDGLQGNASAYINCGIGFLSGQQNNHCAGVWGNTLHTISTPGIDIATGTSVTINGSVQMAEAPGTGNFSFCSSMNTVTTPYRATVLRIVNRTDSNEYQVFHSGIAETISGTSQTIQLNNVWLFNRDGGTPTNRRLQLAGFGDALPDPTAFRTATNTLMTELGVTL